MFNFILIFWLSAISCWAGIIHLACVSFFAGTGSHNLYGEFSESHRIQSSGADKPKQEGGYKLHTADITESFLFFLQVVNATLIFWYFIKLFGEFVCCLITPVAGPEHACFGPPTQSSFHF